MSKVTFSVNSIGKITCPRGKSRVIIYDKKQPKLACIVSPKGMKTFALHTWDRNLKKPIQHTIGRYPEVSINQARDISGKLLGRITEGNNIKEAARAIREEPTVDELMQIWLLYAKQHKRSWRDDERTYDLHIKPTFGTRKISSLTPEQARNWHTKLPSKYRQRKKNGERACLTQATANRCLSLLRAIYNQAAPETTNPCSKVKTFRETSRDRFLKPTELRRFFTALEDEKTPEVLRDILLLLLLTGARRSNLFSMKWNEIDFIEATWTIPANKSKNSETMYIPLVGQTIEILNKRRKEAESVYVFSGKGKKGHVVELKRPWTSLLKRAGLTNVRLHDLRRTCGSYQAACGSSLTVIGKSLGHKNIATTAIYSRITLDPVRDSMEKGAAAMMEVLNKSDKIVNLKVDK